MTTADCVARPRLERPRRSAHRRATRRPLVSVLLPVRDGLPWLADSVASVLRQTHAETQIVIVDDGSRDGSGDWAADLGDSRIVVLRNETPAGVSSALNRGIAACSGEYIARMDADDVSHPDRLRTQIEVLERRPDVGVVGSRIQTVDAAGRPLAMDFDPPAGEALVAWQLLLFTNPVCHPSAVFRRSLALAVGGYDPALTTSQDRDLWSRMMLVSRVVNVPERLLRYRVHGASIGATRAAEQRANSLAIRRRLLQRFLGGDDPGRAILRWYDAPIAAADAAALESLLLAAYDGLVRRLDPPETEVRAVRDDLVRRLGSIRRRDGREAPQACARAALRRLVPAPVRRGIASLRAGWTAPRSSASAGHTASPASARPQPRSPAVLSSV